MMIHRNLSYLALLLVAASPGLVPCGVPTTDAIAAETLSGIMIIEGKTEQGFPYISGGVSTNEREIIETAGKSYNVKLSFADKRGPYLSEVRLVIEGAKGARIISITTPGPMFFIQLPPGNYAVKATFNGETKEIKRLEVAKDKMIQRTLVWALVEMVE
jgi:hypothetical protein